MIRLRRQVRLLFPADRWGELDPALQTEQKTFPEVKLDIQEPQARPFGIPTYPPVVVGMFVT